LNFEDNEKWMKTNLIDLLLELVKSFESKDRTKSLLIMKGIIRNSVTSLTINNESAQVSPDFFELSLYDAVIEFIRDVCVKNRVLAENTNQILEALEKYMKNQKISRKIPEETHILRYLITEHTKGVKWISINKDFNQSIIENLSSIGMIELDEKEQKVRINPLVQDVIKTDVAENE